MKVGIIGAGNAGLEHLFAYSQIKEIEFICISTEGNSCNIPNLHNCKVYDEYKKMICENKLDAISICTPPFNRIDVIRYIAEAGINILCEPPMAKSYSEALEIKIIIEKYKVQFMMGFSLRFSKWNIEVKNLIRDGRLGDVIFARWVFASSLSQNPWFLNVREDIYCPQNEYNTNGKNLKPEMSGIIFDKGCQIFDLLSSLLGLPRTVDAIFLNKRELSVEESAFITLQHSSCVSQLSLSYGTNVHPNRPIERMEIFGTACNIILDQSLGVYSFLPASENILSEYLTKIPESAIKLFLMHKNLIQKENIYLKEIAYFIRNIKISSPINPNHIDGFENVAIMDACYRSIKENCRIIADKKQDYKL